MTLWGNDKRPVTGSGLWIAAVRLSPALSCSNVSMLAPHRAHRRKGPGFTIQQCGQTEG